MAGTQAWAGLRGSEGMMGDRSSRRVVAPTVATATVSSAVAVAVNLATEWKGNLWAWLAVGVLTVISCGVALWLDRRQGGGEARRSAIDGNKQIVSGSMIGRDNIQIGQAGHDVNIDRGR